MNINYDFKNPHLLDVALTHISYANENRVESNQRLEFLGDSILSFVVAEYIYEKFPDFDEGRLTEIRAGAVCEKSLSEIAKKMNLCMGLKLGRAEADKGRYKASILCDTYEAVLGAIYLDGGMNAAKKWIMLHLDEMLETAENTDFRNYKSDIQNYFQKRDKGRDVVEYKIIYKKGPEHLPIFGVEALYKGVVIGRGEGKNLKEAEQKAAKMAIEDIEK